MSLLAAALGLLALILAAWSYLGYPVLIERVSRRASPAGPGGAKPVSLEVILSAADEEGSIEARVKNIIEQQPGIPLRVSVGCDGCRDRTGAIARTALGPAGRVVEFGNRRGKAAVLNDLIAQSAAEVIVFTDANTRFEPDAVRRLADALDDPTVGAVCGRLILVPSGPGRGSETAFWDRETRVKEAEGRLGVCLGANGAIYAARRELIDPLPPAAILDDFLIPARIARKGRKVVFAGGAVAREETGRDAAAEVARRFRIGTGAAAVLTGEAWLFDARRHGLLSLAFLSRKAARWIAPVLALAAALAGLADPRLRGPAAGILGGVALLMLSVAARPRLPGIAGKLYDFFVINIALAAGVVAGLAGYRRPVWRRTR